jgi:hypothetical protein
MRRVLAAGIALAVLFGGPAHAYLKLAFPTASGNVVARWHDSPVRYFVLDRDVPGLTATDLRSALGRAFGAWEAVPTASIAFQFAGFTSAEPGDEDGVTSLGFAPHPELERVLGSTQFLIDDTTGDILEADVFFNSTFTWSVAPGGEAGRFDLESVAVHEIGHLLGLGHSGIGETEVQPGGARRVTAAGAVMFPIAFSSGTVALRALQPDDVAGVSDLYPDGDIRRRTGSASGRVTKDGRGVLGAHVIAFNLATGESIGGFTLNESGAFVIGGLTPGSHILRAEPIDDGDLESYFGNARNVDVSFRVGYLRQFAVVPRGGDAGGLQIQVSPK